MDKVIKLAAFRNGEPFYEQYYGRTETVRTGYDEIHDLLNKDRNFFRYTDENGSDILIDMTTKKPLEGSIKTTIPDLPSNFHVNLSICGVNGKDFKEGYDSRTYTILEVQYEKGVHTANKYSFAMFKKNVLIEYTIIDLFEAEMTYIKVTTKYKEGSEYVELSENSCTIHWDNNVIDLHQDILAKPFLREHVGPDYLEDVRYSFELDESGTHLQKETGPIFSTVYIPVPDDYYKITFSKDFRDNYIDNKVRGGNESVKAHIYRPVLPVKTVLESGQVLTNEYMVEEYDFEPFRVICAENIITALAHEVKKGKRWE